MLGSEISRQLKKAELPSLNAASSDCDITSMNSLEAYLSKTSPSIIINCAAYTNVDGAETETEKANNINITGPKNLAALCKKRNITLIHFSTDYVFDGTKNTPYTETDTPNPINAYGLSKLKGEQAIQSILSDNYYIFRIQWLFGRNGAHFIDTISRLGKEKDSLTIVSDQWGSPTSTSTVAETIVRILAEKPPSGIYNLSAKNYTNWAELTRFIFKLQEIPCNITDVPSSAYLRPAKRPLNSRLNLTKLENALTITLPSWQENVEKYLKETAA